MKLSVIVLLCITLIGCVSEVNRPEICESTVNYTIEDLKYSKTNDSISILKHNWRNYRVDIVKDSISYCAIWTHKIFTTALDSAHSEIENILNDKEFTDELSAHFRLHSTGDIDSLINWPEVKSHIDSMNILYLENNGFSPDKIEGLNPFLESYQTKENMMNSLFKGIVVFHNFYSIDANFTDTLVISRLSFDINKEGGISEAKIRMSYPTSDLVDYVVTSDYTATSDLNFLKELEKLSVNELDFSMLNKVHVIDTIYYRFNRDLHELGYVFAKRNMEMDTMQLIHEIRIEKEGW